MILARAGLIIIFFALDAAVPDVGRVVSGIALLACSTSRRLRLELVARGALAGGDARAFGYADG